MRKSINKTQIDMGKGKVEVLKAISTLQSILLADGKIAASIYKPQVDSVLSSINKLLSRVKGEVLKAIAELQRSCVPAPGPIAMLPDPPPDKDDENASYSSSSSGTSASGGLILG